MTMIELAVFLVNLLIAAQIAELGWRIGSWPGLIIGFPVGFALLPVACWMLGKVLPEVPPRPTCPNGSCDHDDYEFPRSIGFRLVCRCKCGLEFVRVRRRFMRVGPSDTLYPYVVWKRKKGWVADPKGEGKGTEEASQEG